MWPFLLGSKFQGGRREALTDYSLVIFRLGGNRVYTLYIAQLGYTGLCKLHAMRVVKHMGVKR